MPAKTRYAIVSQDEHLAVNSVGKRRKVRCKCTDGKERFEYPKQDTRYRYFSGTKEWDAICPVCKAYYYFKD